jgi:DNA-binding MarR family transcriptional regulator
MDVKGKGPRGAALQRLIQALQQQGRHTVLFHEAVAERVGLNATDSRVLAYLVEVGSATAGRLAELTGLTTGAVTRVIDRLEQRAFVTRQPDPDDRRRVLIVPLREGEGMKEMERVLQAFGRAVVALLEKRSDRELAVIRRFAEESTALMREETARLQRSDEER